MNLIAVKTQGVFNFNHITVAVAALDGIFCLCCCSSQGLTHRKSSLEAATSSSGQRHNSTCQQLFFHCPSMDSLDHCLEVAYFWELVFTKVITLSVSFWWCQDSIWTLLASLLSIEKCKLTLVELNYTHQIEAHSPSMHFQH